MFVSCCVHEQYKHWLCVQLPRVSLFVPEAVVHVLSPSVSMLALKWEQMTTSSCLSSWYQCLLTHLNFVYFFIY